MEKKACCENGTSGCSAGPIIHICHSQQKHCANCIFPPNWNCDCSCHAPQDTQWGKEFEDKFAKALLEVPYHQEDHLHCWEDENKTPPCGQRIEHLKCCLCKLLNPEVERLVVASREEGLREGNSGRLMYQRGKEEGSAEERQFILNVLDGIDAADTQMGNRGGGTRAIRLALQSRYITPSPTNK